MCGSPPLTEVSTGGLLPLASIIKPTSAEDLYDWQVDNGNPDCDPSWANVWPAAAALAQLIAKEPERVRTRTVVELGAGLGVVGLTAAQMGARSVTLVDREPFALHCALSTAECCGLRVVPVPTSKDCEPAEDSAITGLVSAASVDWAEVANDLTVDVVVASEVLFDPREAVHFANCTARLLSGGGTLLLADPSDGRAVGCRRAASEALLAAGATEVMEEVLLPVKSVERLDARVGATSEQLVLLRAEFG